MLYSAPCCCCSLCLRARAEGLADARARHNFPLVCFFRVNCIRSAREQRCELALRPRKPLSQRNYTRRNAIAHAQMCVRGLRTACDTFPHHSCGRQPTRPRRSSRCCSGTCLGLRGCVGTGGYTRHTCHTYASHATHMRHVRYSFGRGGATPWGRPARNSPKKMSPFTCFRVPLPGGGRGEGEGRGR